MIPLIDNCSGDATLEKLNENGDDDDDEDDDNFEDAEDEDDVGNSGAIGKQLLQNGLQSPDSGIHDDKSAIDLTLSA